MAVTPDRDRGALPALRRLAAPLVVFLLVGVLSLLAAHRIAVRDREAMLDRDLAEQVGVTEARIERFGSLVAGAAAHYSQTRHDPAMVTDTELQRYMRSVGADERYDDLPHGLTYIARVREDQVESYEFRRQMGRPRFEVQDGPFRVHQAIIWAQSADVGAHGARLDVDPERATVLEESLRLDEVMMTPPVRGIVDGARVVNIYGPIISRSGEGLGWIGTRVAVDQVVAASDGEAALTITDHNLPVIGEAVPEGHLQRTATLEAMGRTWQIVDHAPTPFVGGAALVICGLLALSAALAVAVVQQSRRRLVSDADSVRRDRDRYAMFIDTMLATVGVGIIACDDRGQIVVVNDAAVQMNGGVAPTGTPDAWLQADTLRDLDGDPLELERMPLFRALRGEDVHDEEVVVDDGGGPRTYLVQAKPLHGDAQRVAGAVLAMNDITDRKAAEAETSRQALRDDLTGLANRRRLTVDLAAALADHRDGGRDVTLLFMDLDRFKLVNATTGPHRGDHMLVEIARHLEEAVHDGDVAARMGGDEFVILCRHATSTAEARALAHRITAAVQPALVVEGAQPVRTGASIGVVRPDRGADVEDVLRQADLAMYEAKRDSGSAIRVYEPRLDQDAVIEFATESALRVAVADRTLDLVFQPITTIPGGQVEAVEALVRWHHGGLVLTPASFLPLADEAALTPEIDLLVLDLACRAVAAAPSRPSVHVNLASRTLARPDLMRQVALTLARHDLAPERLCLEVGETVLDGGAPDVVETLRGLSATGVRLALDDFGVRTASLSHLRGMPLDVVKVHRSVVAGFGSDDADEALAAAAVRVAASRGVRTVAAGIETEAQMRAAARIGCDLAQGFLVGRPGPRPAPASATPLPATA